MSARSTLIILVSTVITLVFWFISIPLLPPQFRSFWHYTSQITANLTIVLMGMSLLMSMRLQLLEKIFGGLDKNYKFHALTGSLAFVFMLMHPLTLAFDKLIAASSLSAGINSALFYFVPGSRLAANIGILAMYAVLFAFTFMTYLKIPYQYWLNTHRVLGIGFLLGSWHAYLAPSQLIRSWPLAIWIGFWIYLGLAACIYSIFLFRKFGPQYNYRITRIENRGEIFNIEMQPAGKQQEKLAFLPGQFMYLRFHSPQLGTELHPFSASSGPDDDTLRFSVKALGDYTATIDDVIKPGDRAEVYGPYGNFGQQTASDTSPVVWIAGGVGVTPFLSMLHTEHRNPTGRPVLFYYSLNQREEAVFDTEINSIAANLPQLHYIKWIAKDAGFLTAGQIISEANRLQYNLQTTKFLICGPLPMTQAICDGLYKHHIPTTNIFSEEFNLIS